MRLVSRFSLALLLTGTLSTAAARAEISAFGDINQTIDPLGYGTVGQPGSIGGNLIVGQTDVAGIIINDNFNPGPLINTGNATVGEQFGSFGAVQISGFPMDWLIGGDLVVGDEGSGAIDLFDSAKVQVGDSSYTQGANPPSSPASDVITSGGLTTIGRFQDGDGIVTLTNIASRLITEDLIVGDLGSGNLVATSRASVVTQKGYIGNGDGSVGYVGVSDLGTRWTVGDSRGSIEGQLFIGNIAGPGVIGEVNNDTQFGKGQGTLNIANQGLVQVSDEVIIGPSGHLRLETQGRLRVLPTSESVDFPDAITNFGLISGNGYVDFVGVVNGPTSSQSSRPLTFLNTAVGTISNSGNATGTNTGGTVGTNQREKLVFTGTAANGDMLTNDGTIQSHGGHMVFDVPVTNNLEIIAIDALMDFNAGLTQGPLGFMVLGGNTTVHGTILPAPLSQITILNDSIVTIAGDLIFTEPFLVAASTDGEVAAAGTGAAATLSIGIGDNPGYLTVNGDLDLTGAVLDLDFAGSGTPDLGSIVNLIQVVDGSVTGTFQNSSVNVAGQIWDIDYSGGNVFATFTGLAPVNPGDFDGDGDVDGRDFLAWQRNPTIGNLADWQTNFGQTGGSLAANVAAVPEPSTLFLLASGIMSCLVRRK